MLKFAKKYSKKLIILILVLAVISVASLFYFKDEAIAWTDTGGGDHGGADWTPANGTYISGVHTSIGTFTVTSGYTIYVQPYNGSSYGYVDITANIINVVGTINASGKGFGGGGGAGATAGGGFAASGGTDGGGGAGANGGAAGAGSGGTGGAGGGTYGGSGGASNGGGDGDGGTGTVGSKGGYLGTGINGDSSTNTSLSMGSGGGGAGAGGHGGANPGSYPDPPYYGQCSGGGGGAGNPGGGYIKLTASVSLTVSGSILTKGLSASMGNGSQGLSWDNNTSPNGYGGGGNGGNGGSAAASGTSSGGGAISNGYMGGTGGAGGAGAGGGILLYNNVEGGITLTSATFDARGGGNDTGNGGTVKVFYGTASAPSVGSNNGRAYTSDLANSKPLAPGSPAASYVSDTQIDVSWTNTSSIEDGYRIYRSVDGGSFASLTTKAANSTSHSDDTVSANHKYQYYIVAYQGTQESDSSGNTSIVYTTPTAPSGVNFTNITSNSATVNWTDNSAHEAGFKVEKSSNGTDYTEVGIASANATSYSGSGTTGLSSNTQYWFRVRAYAGSLNSSYATAASFFTSVTSEILKGGIRLKGGVRLK